MGTIPWERAFPGQALKEIASGLVARTCGPVRSLPVGGSDVNRALQLTELSVGCVDVRRGVFEVASRCF